MADAVSSIRQAKLTLHVVQATDRLLTFACPLHRRRGDVEVLEILQAVGHQLAQVIGLRAPRRGERSTIDGAASVSDPSLSRCCTE